MELEEAVVLPERRPRVVDSISTERSRSSVSQLNRDVASLVYNPALSIREGCPSSLNDPSVTTRWPSRARWCPWRVARDHWWKPRALSING
jgi:hypothetical protein